MTTLIEKLNNIIDDDYYESEDYKELVKALKRLDWIDHGSNIKSVKEE